MLHIREDNLITALFLSKYKAYIFRTTDIKQSNTKISIFKNSYIQIGILQILYYDIQNKILYLKKIQKMNCPYIPNFRNMIFMLTIYIYISLIL